MQSFNFGEKDNFLFKRVTYRKTLLQCMNKIGEKC